MFCLFNLSNIYNSQTSIIHGVCGLLGYAIEGQKRDLKEYFQLRPCQFSFYHVL